MTRAEWIRRFEQRYLELDPDIDPDIDVDEELAYIADSAADGGGWDFDECADPAGLAESIFNEE